MNQQFFNDIHNFSGRSAIFDGVGIFFANYLIYFLILGFLFLVLAEKGPRRKLYWFGEGALATLLARGIVTEVVRFFYHHPRPFAFYGFAPLVTESGSSFPSGHMTFLFALATVVWYANRRWGILYFVLSFAVGVARIYVGVHWPLDILGGAVIGVLCAAIIHRFLRPSRKELFGKTITSNE
jgi:undecaprenyl-diphosphatase